MGASMEMFLVGGIMFWVIVIAELVLLFIGTKKNNSVFCLISIGVFLLFLNFMAKVNLITFVTEKPLAVGLIALVYIFFGCFWAMFKWYLFCKNKINQYDEVFERFLDKCKLDPETKILNDEEKKLFNEYLLDNRYYLPSNLGIKPRIRDNKNEAITWLAFWPISVIIYLLSDLVVDVFTNLYKNVYKNIEGTLQGIADSLWVKRHDIYENLNKEKEDN